MSDVPRVQPIVKEEIAKMKAEQAAIASTKQSVESGSLSGTEMAADGQVQNEASIQTTTTELASESVEVVKTLSEIKLMWFTPMVQLKTITGITLPTDIQE